MTNKPAPQRLNFGELHLQPQCFSALHLHQAVAEIIQREASFFCAVGIHFLPQHRFFVIIQPVGQFLISAILPVENEVEGVTHLSICQRVVGINIEPITVFIRYHMGSKNLIHIKPAGEIKIQRPMYFGNFPIELEIIRP